MPLLMVRNDITKMKVDAIVNAANNSLLGGGGVDGAIHRAAGPGLLEECRKLGGCETGEAKLTRGYDLPAKFVIHTVGPIWHNGLYSEKDILAACYKNSLALAKEYGVETIAFPLISSGAYGYPKDKALQVAKKAIADFLKDNDMTVYIVLFDTKAYSFGKKRFEKIREYIDDRYALEHAEPKSSALNRLELALKKEKQRSSASSLTESREEGCDHSAYPSVSLAAQECCIAADELYGLGEKLNSMLDESFSEMLLRKIDEKGMTDAECYKKANIDRKLFSKIRSDRLYKPSKPTAIAFAIALELPLEETREMLMKAGFALSHSNKFDLIIEYFIENRNYNVYEINEALFAFDQSLLGA